MMTPYNSEFEYSDCESERSFGESSFEVPEISNRIEEEHNLVCMIVNNLQKNKLKYDFYNQQIRLYRTFIQQPNRKI